MFISSYFWGSAWGPEPTHSCLTHHMVIGSYFWGSAWGPEPTHSSPTQPTPRLPTHGHEQLFPAQWLEPWAYPLEPNQPHGTPISVTPMVSNVYFRVAFSTQIHPNPPSFNLPFLLFLAPPPTPQIKPPGGGVHLGGGPPHGAPGNLLSLSTRLLQRQQHPYIYIYGHFSLILVPTKSEKMFLEVPKEHGI